MPLVYQPQAARSTALSLPRLQKYLDQALSGTSSAAEGLSALRVNRTAAMRLLLRSGDAGAMSRFLSLGLMDQEMCARLFAEENPPGIELRSVVMRYLTRISGETPREGNIPGAGSDLASAVNDSRSAVNVPGSAVPSYGPTVDLMERCSLRLGIHVPSLRLVLGQMPVVEDGEVHPAGTDRRSFLVEADSELYSEEARDLLLHMIMHCVFNHMRIPADAAPGLWDLAADIAAEYNRKLFFPDSAELPSVFRLLPEGLTQGSAAEICRWLSSCGDPRVIEEAALCHRDDHSPWYRRKKGSEDDPPGPSDRDWQNALSLPGPQISHRRGFAPGSREDKMILREEARHDFRAYLRRFSTVREEIQTDYDSFDYIPYYYGTLMNPDLPLLEPLEYTEANKVEQLVIAIDTSGSCDLPTIQSFLAEVHGILTQKESFFRKMEVHIFQCDSAIQDHTILRSSEMWEDYIRDITIHGRGGTDFTPVFRKVEEIRAAGGLSRLKGLIYFTDGDGVYPREAPDYETAFVFSVEDYQRFLVPEWIIPLLLKGSKL